MSQSYFNVPHQPGVGLLPPYAAASRHHQPPIRSRRSNRYTSVHHSNKALKSPRAPREAKHTTHSGAFRKDFEAARSFDLEDDEIFCPFHLLTEDDLQSIHSSSSDRSSSSSGSPDSSPLQHQIAPTPSFTLSAAANPHVPSSTAFHHGNSSHLKIHQPLAQRTRNAIPIVDPNSRNASPPNSVSPARQQPNKPFLNRRWQ